MKPSFSDNFDPAPAPAPASAPALPQKGAPAAALTHPRQDSAANSLSPGPPTALAQRAFDFGGGGTGSGFDDDFSKSPIFQESSSHLPRPVSGEPENRLGGSATPASLDSQPPSLMTASMEAVAEPQTAEDSLKQFVGESATAAGLEGGKQGRIV